MLLLTNPFLFQQRDLRDRRRRKHGRLQEHRHDPLSRQQRPRRGSAEILRLLQAAGLAEHRQQPPPGHSDRVPAAVDRHPERDQQLHHQVPDGDHQQSPVAHLVHSEGKLHRDVTW